MYDIYLKISLYIINICGFKVKFSSFYFSYIYIYLEIQLLEIYFICCRDVVIYVLFIENEGIEKGLDILLEVVMRFVILDEQVFVFYVVKLNQQVCIKLKIYVYINYFLFRFLIYVFEVFLYVYKEFYF